MTETLAPPQPVPAVTTVAVERLVAAVREVAREVPVDLPGPLALADARALLATLEQLHAAVLGRLADVDRRQLFALDRSPSSATWVAAQASSLDRTEVTLARRLASFPVLRSALTGEGEQAAEADVTGEQAAETDVAGHPAQTGVPAQREPAEPDESSGTQAAARRAGCSLAIASARHVAAALAKLRVHCDRPHGLIDGQPGEAVVTAVVRDGVLQLLAEAAGGLPDHDLRLLADQAVLHEIASMPISQLARLERAFVLLARRVEPCQLHAALTVLTDGCCPASSNAELRQGTLAGPSRSCATPTAPAGRSPRAGSTWSAANCYMLCCTLA